MLSPNNKNIHAMVIASQKVVEIMGKDLISHFLSHKVALINIEPALGYGSDAVTLFLTGKQNDIEKSLDKLKVICYQKELGVESAPAKSLPPVIKGYLLDMENEFKFGKIFSYCSKEYLDYCKAHNVKPHPEVIETIKN